jgi:predicted nuclease of predicted toxin-antitoxin system
MKILLDECVPWPMHRLLSSHQCATAQKRGWGGIKNGDLIRLAEGEFDLFITSDQNIRYQQNLADRRIAILELSTNDLRTIQVGAADLVHSVASIAPGEFRRLNIPGKRPPSL